ncbi:LAETG motif-containing sortase-dependent surface protein [Streptomyces sp. NPDC048361]|uniref:LAETG motif-containing sortase-dependent surface protein n=1 Tax=Streptomyces sp. NPDC048361 TaxID=3154720 RepID=UPI00341B1509
MTTKRAVTAAVATATAAVLMSAQSAYACTIGDFTAKVTCDTSTGKAMSAIIVTDKDPSGTPADISVRIRLADGFDSETVGSGHIAHPTAAGVSTTILVPLMQGYQWNIHVTAGSIHDELLTNLPVSPEGPCVVASSHPSSTPSHPTHSATPSAAATPTSPAAAPGTSTSPAPSAASSSPAAGTGLAETGGGSNTALIGGAAALVITAGAGVLFATRRRTGSTRH